MDKPITDCNDSAESYLVGESLYPRAYGLILIYKGAFCLFQRMGMGIECGETGMEYVYYFA